MSAQIQEFVSELSSYRSNNVFNPYSDICDLHDKNNASEIRRENLKSALFSISQGSVDDIWIGRDLGYRGGRRTGLALTDEGNLGNASDIWNAELRQATLGEECCERTAGNIWRLVRRIDKRVFMWNIFPFHPHEFDSPFSNRCHTSTERETGLEILKNLVEMLQPSRLIAIGNDSYNSSKRVFQDWPVEKVRHPSYGGEKEFLSQMENLYRLPRRKLSRK